MIPSIKIRFNNIIDNNPNIPLNSENLNLNESLKNIGLTSVLFVQLVVAIETEFDIEFGDNDLDINRFKTLRDIIDYVEKKCQQK